MLIARATRTPAAHWSALFSIFGSWIDHLMNNSTMIDVASKQQLKQKNSAKCFCDDAVLKLNILPFKDLFNIKEKLSLLL
jgi:hypothetical protein